MNARQPLNPLRAMRIAAILVAFGVAAFGIARALPPRSITIEAGPVEGSYYQTALKYRDVLRERGIDVKIVSNPDTTRIIADVDRDGANVDVGFSTQISLTKDYPHLGAAGVAELQPLFVFAQASVGEMPTLAGLRGKRIALPPQESATSVTVLQILKLFGVTPANTPISFMPISRLMMALKGGEAEVGFLILGPSSPMIADLVATESLRLLNMDEAKGIARQLPFLRTAELPRGSFDVWHVVPATDIELLAAPVNVVMRKDLHPAAAYMLLEAMKEVHHGATLISESGQFPSLTDTNMPPHPLMSEYAKSGLPWVYQNLPLPIASLIDRYLIIAIALLVLKDMYLNFTGVADMINSALRAISLRVLRRIARSTKSECDVRGLRLVAVDLAERGLFGTDQDPRCKELLARLRGGAGVPAPGEGAASSGPA